MLSDYSLIVHKFPKFKEVVIVPIFDEHIGSPNHLDERWHKRKKYILDNNNVFCTIGGDMMNNAIVNSKSDVYRDRLNPSEQKEWLTKELKDFADEGKILSIVPGNHEKRSTRTVDDNPLYDVAYRLKVDHLYRNVRCYTKIIVGNRKGEEKGVAFIGLNMHGSFGGKTAGDVLAQLEKLSGQFSGIDYMIAGHAHKGGFVRPEKFVVNPYNNTVTLKEVVIASATSGVGYEDYAAEKNYSPASNKIQKIILREDSTQKDYKDIETIW